MSSAPGGAHVADGVMTVRGSGRNIGERSQGIDNCQYAFTDVRDDVIIEARLRDMRGRTRSHKAGVMLRQTVADDAPNVSLLFFPRRGLRMFARAEEGGITRKTDDLKLEAEMPAWLRLKREGHTFTAYTSEDGERWTQVGDTVTIDMPSKINAGLTVTARTIKMRCLIASRS